MPEPREELGKKLSSYLTPEQIAKLIDEVLAIEKRISAEFVCKSCGQRQMRWTTAPDAKANQARAAVAFRSYSKP